MPRTSVWGGVGAVIVSVVCLAVLAGMLIQPAVRTDLDITGYEFVDAAVSNLISNAAAHPRVVVVLVGLLAFRQLIRWASGLRQPPKDPQRMFTADQRRAGFARAQDRCEMVVWGAFRCRRPAEHADHWLPHSRGGASDMRNLVAACAVCNLRKSNKVPSWLDTARLERRRARYFPAGHLTAAGSNHIFGAGARR